MRNLHKKLTKFKSGSLGLSLATMKLIKISSSSTMEIKLLQNFTNEILNTFTLMQDSKI